MSYDADVREHSGRRSWPTSARPALTSASGCIITPQGTTIRVADGKPVLNLCANNYLAWRSIRRWPPPPRRRSTAGATAWPACGSSAARRACTSSWKRKLSEFLGTEDTILYSLLLRRQRRPVRDAARRGGRRHLRRTEPRQHHRRHPALQGPALPLPQQRHGRPGGEAARRPPARASG